MGNSNKKILVVSPVLIGIDERISEINCACAAELGCEISRVHQIRDLFPLICDPEQQIDMIGIDLDYLSRVVEIDLFDEMRALITMLNTMPSRDPDGSLAPRKVVIVGGVSLSTDPAAIKEFLALGPCVHGLSPRGPEFTKEEKILALSEFLEGKCHIPERVQQMMKRRRAATITDSKDELTPRQRQILALISKRGSSNKVIAKTLNISESTVKLHLGNIFKKYGVRNRTQLALFSQSDQK